MRITQADLDALKRRASRPKGRLFVGGFEAFVPGVLQNPLNQKWHHMKVHRWKRAWEDKITDALLAVGYRRGSLDPCAPKCITFAPRVRQRFDSTDGIRAALKPFPDALKTYGVIDDDRDSAGHTFVYATQVIDRANPGVVVLVETLPVVAGPASHHQP